MKRAYSIDQVPNALDVLRKAGYSYFKDPQSGEESFVLRLTPEFYPRFHLYVEEAGGQISFNLHLDQKKPSYGQEKMHSGEYEGTTVENELRRIDGWVRSVSRQAEQPVMIKQSTSKTWWQKIFGGRDSLR